MAKALIRRDSELEPLKYYASARHRLTLLLRFAMIYHLAKDAALKRANTIPGNLGLAKPLPASPPPLQAKLVDETDLTRQASDLYIK